MVERRIRNAQVVGSSPTIGLLSEVNMGCLKSIVKKIIFIAIVVAFFALGGYTFVKNSINDYQNPPRDEFVKTEKNYADFSKVSGDYQLSRSFNLFGYKKINAKYLPTGQKITIYDLKNENTISPKDFQTKEIDTKINNLLNKLKDSFITLEEFQVIQRGSYIAKNKTIPFIKFSAKVKNVPFKNVVGIIACYSTTNEKAKEPSSKLIVTIVDKKAFNPTIAQGFINALKF